MQEKQSTRRFGGQGPGRRNLFDNSAIANRATRAQHRIEQAERLKELDSMSYLIQLDQNLKRQCVARAGGEPCASIAA